MNKLQAYWQRRFNRNLENEEIIRKMLDSKLGSVHEQVEALLSSGRLVLPVADRNK